MLYTINKAYEHSEEIKKSRFLSRAFPLTISDEADEILATIRQEAATHHCFAWKFGQNYRFNDDGEPTGTAGKPILTSIEGRNCDHILVVVTRWYGGIQLGTGGLARAYGGGTARLLQQAELVPLIAMTKLEFHCLFHELPLLESRLDNFNAQIQSRDFGAQGVDLIVQLPTQQSPDFAAWLNDISRGRIVVTQD